MKINGEEINVLEEGKESLLDETVNKFFVIKKFLQENKLPPHESNYVKYFRENYKLEFDVEEMIEFRSFCEEDYAGWKQSQIADEFARGGSFVDLKGMGLE
ncbi:MAG: hypothetical protein M0P61_00260 [Ignavibacteriaceae bacterium]|jgi:hypothetical protein|nr:hypothetical protein [Ignavibacteriaceae bacterium]